MTTALSVPSEKLTTFGTCTTVLHGSGTAHG